MTARAAAARAAQLRGAAASAKPPAAPARAATAAAPPVAATPPLPPPRPVAAAAPARTTAVMPDTPAVLIRYLAVVPLRIVGANSHRTYDFTSASPLRLVAREDAAVLLASPSFRLG